MSWKIWVFAKNIKKQSYWVQGDLLRNDPKYDLEFEIQGYMKVNLSFFQ